MQVFLGWQNLTFIFNDIVESEANKAFVKMCQISYWDHL